MVAVNFRRFKRVTFFYIVLTYYCVQCQDECESGAVPCEDDCVFIQTCCFDMFEAVEIGSVIGNVNIVSSINDILTNGSGSISHDTDENFLVNETTGVVTMNRVVDREASMTCLPLSITVNVGGQDDLIIIGVIVRDINDNSPTFNADQFTKEKMEGTDVNLCISTTYELEATDIDDGLYGAITYSLAGDAADKFNISDYEDDENCIRNIVELDREEVSDPSNTHVYLLILLLVATDGGWRSSNITLIINITDVNDNDPMFTDASLETVFIKEDTMNGVVIRDLNATDLDYNSVLTFSLVDETVPFIVNSTTGEVSVRTTLQPRSYILEIAVTDSERITVSNLNIEVEDVNDRADIVFEFIKVDSKDVDCIEEETVSEKLLIRYEINDEDNNNYLITLSGPHTENFTATVSSTSFSSFILITLCHPIDEEELFRDTGKRIIELNIQVKEVGKNTNITQSLSINISICGINDNKPFLNKTEYTAEEERNGNFGELDMQDLDSGDDGIVVSFCIVSALSSPGMTDLTTAFQNNNRCNQVTLISPSLDREAGIEYIVVAMNLTDGGNLSNIVNITINLTDINDNYPIFTQQDVYDFEFNEGIDSIGKRLGMVIADDADLGTNAEVCYELVDHTDLFSVDNITGEVSTLVEFDREEKESYIITIRAKNVVPIVKDIDPSTLSEVSVSVTVKDLNDSPPVWENKNVIFSTSSDSAVGDFVAEVTADDPDIHPEIMYDIEGSVLFSVDMSGVIKVAADLTEEIGSHSILLIASDGVHPTPLNITIEVNKPTSLSSSNFVIIVSVSSVCFLFVLVLVVMVIILVCVYINKYHHSVRLAKRDSKYEIDGIGSPQRGILRQIPSSSSGFTSRSSSANGNSRGVKFEPTVQKFGYDYEHAVNNSSDLYVTQSSIHLDSSGDESSPITPPRLPTTSSHHPNGKIPMSGQSHLTNGAPRLSPIQENFLFTSHGMRRTHPIQDERYSEDDYDGNSDDDSTLPDNASSTNAPLPSVRHLSHMAASPHSTPPGSHLAPHHPMAQISPPHQFQRSPDHGVGLNPPHHDQLSIHSSSSESLTVTPPPMHSHDNQRLSRPSARGPYPAHMPEGYVMPPSSSSRYGAVPFMDRFTGTDFEDASTYASAELDEALHFRPDQEPGIFSLTATSSYDEESQL